MERVRLARVFYHLELYGNLFDDPEVPTEAITSHEQAHLFWERLEGWEVEELLCVRTYLFEKSIPYLDEAEEVFLQDYIDMGPPSPKSFHAFDPIWDNDEGWFFSNDGPHIQEEWLDRCPSRGLQALKVMFNAQSPDDKLNSLGSTHIPRTTIHDALKALPIPGREAWLERYDDIGDQDSIENHNIAWRWLLKAGHVPRQSIDPYSPMMEGLRRWGWAIWSTDTLNSLGLMKRK